MATASNRTGVLVVRAWLEDGFPNVVRARITQTVDVSAPESVVTVARGTEEVVRAVRTWLDTFVQASTGTSLAD